MSRRLHRPGKPALVILEPTPDSPCDLCGTVAELRPYGPNGESICFTCGMADEATSERKMREVLFGNPPPGSTN